MVKNTMFETPPTDPVLEYSQLLYPKKWYATIGDNLDVRAAYFIETHCPVKSRSEFSD